MKGPDNSSQHYTVLEASRESAVRSNQRLESLERIFLIEAPTLSGGASTQAHQGRRAPVWLMQWKVNRVSVWWWCHMSMAVMETWHQHSLPSWLLCSEAFMVGVCPLLLLCCGWGIGIWCYHRQAVSGPQQPNSCCYGGNNQACKIAGSCWASFVVVVNAVFILLLPLKLRCSSAEKWQIEMWFIYTTKLFLAIKKNKSLAEKWMQLEIITLSKLRQSEEDK